jgi:hypothetical protein
MGRIRTIKPEFFTDEELSSVSEPTHILAAGLLCYADDEGYFNANYLLIKAALFPIRDPSMTIHGMLNELSGIGFVELGTTPDGKMWGRVVKFNNHQRVNRPSPSKIKCLPIVWDLSMNIHTQIIEESLPEGKGREGKGREGKGALDAPSPPPLPALPWDSDPEDNIPEGLSILQYANFVLEICSIPSSYGLKVKMGDAIDMLSRDENFSISSATKHMLDRVRAAPSGTKWNFWLQDGGWKQTQHAGVSTVDWDAA